MAGVSESVAGVLEPYVGRVAADTCIRASALSVGKDPGTLDASDCEVLASSVRRMLGPMMTNTAMLTLLREIRRVCS